MITKGLMKNHRCQRSSMDWIMPMSVPLIVCKYNILISDFDHCTNFIFINSHYVCIHIHVLQSAGNFNQQLLPFIISLFLYSTFVSLKGPCYFGWAWLFFRSYYLFIWLGCPVFVPVYYSCILLHMGNVVRYCVGVI